MISDLQRFLIDSKKIIKYNRQSYVFRSLGLADYPDEIQVRDRVVLLRLMEPVRVDEQFPGPFHRSVACGAAGNAKVPGRKRPARTANESAHAHVRGEHRQDRGTVQGQLPTSHVDRFDDIG